MASCRQYEGKTDAGLGTCSVHMHRAKHAADDGHIDRNEAITDSMRELGTTENYKPKWQVVLSSSETAEMIIRCVDLCLCPCLNL